MVIPSTGESPIKFDPADYRGGREPTIGSDDAELVRDTAGPGTGKGVAPNTPAALETSHVDLLAPRPGGCAAYRSTTSSPLMCPQRAHRRCDNLHLFGSPDRPFLRWAADGIRPR